MKSNAPGLKMRYFQDCSATWMTLASAIQLHAPKEQSAPPTPKQAMLCANVRVVTRVLTARKISTNAC